MYSASCIIMNDFEDEVLRVVNVTERQTFHRSILAKILSSSYNQGWCDYVQNFEKFLRNTFDDNACSFGKLCTNYVHIMHAILPVT